MDEKTAVIVNHPVAEIMRMAFNSAATAAGAFGAGRSERNRRRYDRLRDELHSRGVVIPADYLDVATLGEFNGRGAV